MSIIQEALKKAESDIKPAAASTADVELRPPAVMPKVAAAQPARKQQKPRMKINAKAIMAISLSAVMVLMIFYAGPLLLKIGGKPKIAQDVVYKPITREAVTERDQGVHLDKPALSMPILKTPRHPDLMLNGIMYIQDAPRAIINNGIVVPGDSVSGAIVKRIEPQSVVLEYGNVEITLNLK